MILTQISYKPHNFLLFKLDVRCKIISLCILSIMIGKADFLHLFLISNIIFWMLYRCNISIIKLIKESKYFFILLFFVFIVRFFATPDTPIPISNLINNDILNLIGMDIKNIPPYIQDIYIKKEGLSDAVKVTWRFLLIMLMGILFSYSTSSSSLKYAVEWFFKPIPFIPEKRVGTMITLFVRFLPLIFEKAFQVSEAQKSRCAHLQKNPFKRIKNITIPLFSKVFKSADILAIAMASRCYNENRVESAAYNNLKSGYEVYFYSVVVILTIIIIFF